MMTLPENTKTGLGVPGRLKRTSLELPENLEYGEWEGIGETLSAIEGSVMWWIGDWLNYGEVKYGEIAYAANNITEYTHRTLQQAAYVCRKVQPSVRTEGLGFMHHQVVATLPPEQQEKWLAFAAPAPGEKKARLTVAQLRAEIAAARKAEESLGDDEGYDGPDVPEQEGWEPEPTNVEMLDREELEELARKQIALETRRREVEKQKEDLRKQGLQIIENPQAFPDAKFRVIEADPPWALRSQEKKSQHYQYPTMELGEIKAMSERILSVVEGDAHLYLWAINPMLEEAFAVARAWGFEFKTLITWHKSNGFGTGHYFRGQTEHVLFCVRGSLPTLSNNTPNFFSAPRSKHSEKPMEFYDIVERSSPGPYLRLFARSERVGWTSWGDEV